MPYLSNEEMKTHLYAENVDVISRGDETIMTAAIDGAIIEAKGYLTAYDLDKVFNMTGGDRNALLLIFIKDLAAWHFLVLCNAGHEYKMRQDRYDRAIAWFRGVQKGDINPNLPALENPDGGNSADTIKFGSNPQKEQHF